jgi:hypothetical protein
MMLQHIFLADLPFDFYILSHLHLGISAFVSFSSAFIFSGRLAVQFAEELTNRS